MVFGAIDFGSNLVRLLVVQISNAQPSKDEKERKIKVLYDHQWVIGLGKSLHQTGKIDPAAVLKLEAILEDELQELRLKHANIFFEGVGTASFRQATNAEEIANRLSDKGISLRVLSGTEEAEMAASASAFADLPDRRTPDFRSSLVIDVGGRSTELVLLRDSKDEERQVERSCSLPFGTFAAFETGATNLPSVFAVPAFANLRASWVTSERNPTSLWIGGTASALRRLFQNTFGEISRDDLERTHIELGSSVNSSRVEDAFGKDRAHLADTSIAWVNEISRQLELQTLRFSDLGLVHGMVVRQRIAMG